MNGKKVDSPFESLTVLFMTNTLFKKSDSSIKPRTTLGQDVQTKALEHAELHHARNFMDFDNKTNQEHTSGT